MNYCVSRTLLLLCGLLLLCSGCRQSDTTSSPSTGSAQNPTSTGGSATASTSGTLSRDDYATAIHLNSRGIGHLENKEWDEAEAAFSQLHQLLPDNATSRQNLAVSRVLALIDRESPFTKSGAAENANRYRDAVTSARTAVDEFQRAAVTDDQKALADLLLGKLLVHDDSPESPSFEQGLNALRQAATALPERADLQFALAMAMDGHREYADPNSPKAAQLLQALSESLQKAPQNLFALHKLMQRQALCLNSKVEQTRQQALQIQQTLRTAIELLQPLNESIQKQRRVNLIDTITKALADFSEDKPATLMGPAMMTGNLLLPELSTQIDQRRLNRNLLEYLQLTFEPDFMKAAEASGALPTLEPTVVKTFVRSNGLPSVTGVTDVDLQDMNLDGIDDLIVAREGKIEVYTRTSAAVDDWSLLMTTPDDVSGITHFLLIDVDRDYDKALSDIKTPSILRDADGDRKIVTDPAGNHRWYDTDLDLVAWSHGGVHVFRNVVDDSGIRALTTLPQAENVSGVNQIVAADLEADGDLDLVIATDTGMTLWKNLDGTTFENANASASLPEAAIMSLAVVDWNQDVAIDVVTVAADGSTGVLENMLHGRFRWLPMDVPKSTNLSFAIGQVDADRDWDLVDSGLDGPAPEVVCLKLADLDNDGFFDRVFSRDGETYWHRGRPAGGFEETAEQSLPEGVSADEICVADIDDDGDSDLILIDGTEGSPAMLLNDGGNLNHWLDVVARAVPDDPQFPSNRVNMHAIGAVIELRSGTLYHSQVITEPRIRLGLGRRTQADTIRIIWTDGIPQNVTLDNLLKPRVGILAPQILKGSCPYIYTWTGERFEFFSDCLWAAPLGLVQATGDLAPTREWENLLIPGERLVAKDGRYVLQLTEELWETAYFDQVQLTAIDHPADVQIFTNEKVGPPDLAEHRVHTVQRARQPKSVVDGRGNDLLPGLRQADGQYVRAFQRRLMQGLTDEWIMEFDSGLSADELAELQNVRLFLTGWIFPTDTSLNVGISQNASLSPPMPPQLEVPVPSDGPASGHARNDWKVVRPFIGFPSGKTKAMVVDITDVIREGHGRFRLRSSMELYWDQAFLTVNEVDTETVSQECSAVMADLHFRGFSRRRYADDSLFRQGFAPENYDYSAVTTQSRWPAIGGRFTRYGDTLSLVQHHDDQMVVMGPGDELTLSFAVPAKPVPEGWKRDFVLTNVGFDKDADLNTIYGQTSEPFPFRTMSRYPFSPEQTPPETEEYHEYLRRFQTREYSSLPFRDAVRTMSTGDTIIPH
ncbi:MAG: VCBS repeat-containing protein [Planctomycetaceae bacterium]|nr:VCBS repeat-containing protein [Planctomycetaceae bacterium]